MNTRGSDRGPLPWYRLPFVWLAMAVFAASIAGCVWIIVVSVQYRDEPVPAPAHSVLGVPAQRPPPPGSS